MDQITTKTATDATWDRMDRLCSLLESAVKDVRRGVNARKGYQVAMGLVSITGVMTEALRLQGRVDQLEENQALGLESGEKGV